MSRLLVSVIICTHNPRVDFFVRTLASLKSQSLPKDCWELLVVDNDSSVSLKSIEDLSWHPYGRNVLQKRLGLTHARLKGIAEAKAPLLVFVDDDNVLAPDYLEQVLAISDGHPFLGAWSGSVAAEYEQNLPKGLWDRGELLAVRQCAHKQWGYGYGIGGITPYGAGMCVRKHVADRYLADCTANQNKEFLDRRGTSLSSGGDVDIAFTSLDCGLGIGRFPKLRLTHLIPSSRTTVAYLARLAFGSNESSVLLNAKRPETAGLIKYPSFKSLLIYLLFALPHGLSRMRIVLASWKGIRSGFEKLKSAADSPPPSQPQK